MGLFSKFEKWKLRKNYISLVVGGMQDYNYVYKGTFELTLEISCCKYPPERDLPKLWDQNRDALVAYLQNAHMGK